MLEWTGERYLPNVDPAISGAEIHYEHLHRYAFASQFVKGKKVLDLASGEGYGTFILSKNAQSVTGIEIDPVAVSHAQKTYEKENIEFKEGSILNIPIAGEKLFDVIVCFEAIEHVREHDVLLNEVRRLLKDDGLLIISTPDKKHYSEDPGYKNPYHLKELYQSEFSDLLKKHFSYVYLSSQQVFSGSSIDPVSSKQNSYSSEFVIEYKDQGFSFIEKNKRNPRYFIALASDTGLNPKQIQRSYLIDKSNAEITFLLDKINRSNDSIQSQKTTISAQESRILQSWEKIQSLETTISAQESRILQSQEKIQSLETTISAQESRILQSWEKIQSLETTISAQDSRILQSQEKIQSLETTISAQENQILRSQEKIQSLECTITEQDLRIKTSETQVRALEEHVAVQNQNLSTAHTELEYADQIIKAKESEIVRLNSRLNQSIDEIDSLKSTISYRLLAKFQKKIVEPLLPLGTKRRELYDLGLKGGRITVSRGFGKALSEYKRYRSSQKSIPGAPQIPSPVPAPEIKTAGTPDGSDTQTIIHLHDQNQQKSTEYIPLSHNAVILTKDDIRCIAFYLPQFHPIPENDQWWGKGFTEWTNVTKALPQFIGHYQPHLPDELGFYDLRLPEIQKRQIELARHYGIYGFCFHYYWFNGKKLLERPLNQFLEHKEFDYPFCICWANENWTRRWDGMEHEVLISQTHSSENDIHFIRDIEHILCDSRYIRIDGKPLLLVYRAALLPDAKETTRRWREYCKSSGIGDLYLVAALAFGCEDPTEYGFDAAVEFPPHSMSDCNIITKKMQVLNPHFSGIVYDYKDFVLSRKYGKNYPFRCFRTVSPGWDNTARRLNNASVFYHANPGLYKEWLSDVTRLTKETYPKGEQLVFINAWNEWAEGTHLEPDRKFGYGYLQATADAIRETRDPVESLKKKIIVVSHDAHPHGAQMIALTITKKLNEQFHYEIYVLLKSGGILKEEFEKYAEVYDLEKDYNTNESLERLIDKLSENGCRIALTNTVVSGDLVPLLSRKKIHTISLIHELPGIIRDKHIEDRLQDIAGFAEYIVFPSSYVQTQLQSLVRFDQNKCVIVPQGLYLKNRFRNEKENARRLLREQFNLSQNTKIVLGVGYADFRKGIDIFAEVAKRVIQSDRTIYFIWVGHCDESFMAGVRKFIQKSRISENIIFPGRKNDMSLYYAGSDLLLLTSREDPFPSVVLESMDAGVPVIGFDNAGGFKDLITEDTGILVPDFDREEMSTHVINLLNDNQLREKLGITGSALIDTKYRFEDYIFTLLALLGHKYRKTTIIIPNYNYERYLEERTNSILGQNYPIYEIIFLDDCSTDQSVRFIENFALRCPVKITIIKNETNSGSVFYQWAQGIDHAKGDFIWIAEADDLSETGFLSAVLSGFDDPEVNVSYCQSKQTDDKGQLLAPDYLEYTNDIDENKWKKDYIQDGIEEIRSSLVIKNTIPNVSAVVFKKVNLHEIGDDLIRFRVVGDWLFYVWLLQQGKISFVARPLNLHRRHESGVTLSENKQRHFDEIVEMQEYILHRFDISESTVSKTLQYREKVKKYLLN